MPKFEKLMHLYYVTFVKWGDVKFSGRNDRPWLHALWMWTIGLPFTLYLLYIWWGPWGRKGKC